MNREYSNDEVENRIKEVDNESSAKLLPEHYAYFTGMRCDGQVAPTQTNSPQCMK